MEGELLMTMEGIVLYHGMLAYQQNFLKARQFLKLVFREAKGQGYQEENELRGFFRRWDAAEVDQVHAAVARLFEYVDADVVMNCFIKLVPPSGRDEFVREYNKDSERLARLHDGITLRPIELNKGDT